MAATAFQANGTKNYWAAYGTWEITTSSDTSATLTVNGYCRGINGSTYNIGNNGGLYVKVTNNGQTQDGTTVLKCTNTQGTNSSPAITKAVTITKTHAAQSIPVSVYVQNGTGVDGGHVTASATATIPAKTSYAIKFDANGGANAPGAQTKWYGETLVLSNTTPTRSGYDFKGWATSKTATSANYQPGANYTANSGTTLYAVWAVAYTLPTVTSSSAYRCTSATNSTASPTGGYIYVNVKWKKGSTNVTGVTVQYRKTSTATFTTLSNDALSNPTFPVSATGEQTTSGTFVADTTSSYEVVIMIVDANGGTKVSKTVSTAKIPFQISNSGKNIGLLHPSNYNDAVVVGSSLHAVDGATINIRHLSQKVANTPSANTNVAYHVRDMDGVDVSYFGARFLTDGRNGTELKTVRTVNGTAIYNGLDIYIDASGNKSIAVSDAAIWRSAIGLKASTNTTNRITLESGFTFTSMTTTATANTISLRLEVKTTTARAANTAIKIGTLAAGWRPSQDVNVFPIFKNGWAWISSNGSLTVQTTAAVSANDSYIISGTYVIVN